MTIRSASVADAEAIWQIFKAVVAGYQAMQFNFVVSTNNGTVHLWQELGFTTLAAQPKAVNHSTPGYVDAYVMHRCL
jgi:L-amino acid N-acyltransferase YncA